MCSNYLKAQFCVKGLHGSWDRLGAIYSSITNLHKLKMQVLSSLGASYKGLTHKDADTKVLVSRIALKAKEYSLQTEITNHSKETMPVLVPDCCKVGLYKYVTGSLANLNKKVNQMKAGKSFFATDDEPDELPPPDFVPILLENSDEL